MIITCLTNKDCELVKKNPAVIDEDYATCSCICQNLLLLLENKGIATKWSTGAVWEHPEFAKTIHMVSPENERVVGLIFYGYSTQKLPARPLAPLKIILKILFQKKIKALKFSSSILSRLTQPLSFVLR